MRGRYRFPTSPEDAERSVVVHVLREAGWAATDGDDWDLLWTHEVAPDRVYDEASPAQVLNHLPGIGALTRKDRLARTIAAAVRRSGTTLVRLPRTYVLPEDHEALLAEDDGGPWIVKPRGGARGEWIRVVAEAASIPLESGWIVQRYVDRPHLIDGFKYTLRWYVAVTSVDPLAVHIFDDGFTKFASRPFRSDRASLADVFVHLTNPDVLAHDPTVATSSRNLTRPAYRARLEADGHDADALLAEIRRSLATCVLAAREELVRRRRGAARGFELLGFDVLVDDDLRPWVIECNLGPSIAVEADPTTRAAREETDLKRRLARDLFALAGVTAPWTGAPFAPVGGFELAWPAPDDDLWRVLALPRPADADAARRPLPGAVVGDEVDLLELGDEGLVVLPPGGPRPLVLNPAAAAAFVGASAGLAPTDIVVELADAGANGDVAAVWDALGDLADHGAVRRDDVETTSAAASTPPPPAATAVAWNASLPCRVGGVTVSVHAPSPELRSRLASALDGWLDDRGAPAVHGLVDIRPDDRGLGWDVGGVRIWSLRQAVPAARAAVLRKALFAGARFTLRATLVRAGGRVQLLVGPRDERAARAASADAVLGDDDVEIGPGRRATGRLVGLLAPIPHHEWVAPLPDDVHVDLDGSLVREHRFPAVGSPVEVLVDEVLVLEPDAEQTRTHVLRALLRAGLGPCTPTDVAALVDLSGC